MIDNKGVKFYEKEINLIEKRYLKMKEKKKRAS